MNELKQQQATLIAEREELENSLPQLESDWRHAPSDFSSKGNMIGSAESREAEDRLASAQSRIHSIVGELDRIEQKLARMERLELVEQARTESIQIMSDSTLTIETLERSRAHLSERLEDIRTESERALESAQQAERDAASLYARSLASGDREGEKTANSDIQKAAKQLATTDELVRRQELVIVALQTELDSMAAQISTAQKQHDAAKDKALSAIGLTLEVEWNEAAQHLAVIGSQILAVSYQRGGMGDALSRLDVPRFGPGVSSLDRQDLAAAAHVISLADLIAA